MSSCKHCGLCCQTMVMTLSEIDFDRKWVEGRGGTIKGFYVILPMPCKWLGDDNRCRIYEERPEFCREFPKEPADWLVNMGCRFYER